MKKRFRIVETHEVKVYSYVTCHTLEEAEELFGDGNGEPDFEDIITSEYVDQDYETVLEVP